MRTSGLVAAACHWAVTANAVAVDVAPLQERQEAPELAYSPPDYPSPWMDPNANGWEQAYAQAKDFVSQMTLLEKVNLTTGVG
jgi:hypothetical protein